jgi:hypothetical protein
LQLSSVQGLLSLQTRGVPPQTPPEQTSAVVHALPSLQDAALLECEQPVDGLQESFVQMLLSLQLTRLPPPHTPALQVSPVVHALPSLQGSVLGV